MLCIQSLMQINSLRLPANLLLPLMQIGFFALLIVEFVAKRGLLDLLGFRIGQGLPFEI